MNNEDQSQLQDNPEQKIIKLSASSIKTYESCEQKYFYTYIEKAPKKEWQHLTLGKFAHSVLEQFHKEWKADQNLELAPLMGHCFSEQRTKYDNLTADILEEAKEILQNYLYSVEKRGMPNVLDVEFEFKLSFDDYLLRGFVDRLDIDKDGLFHIVDYKTTKNEKYLDNFQLLVYGLALKNRFPEIEKFRASYILLRKDSRYVTDEFNTYDIEKCKQKIIEYGHRIKNEQTWQKRPSPLCNWCDFYDICMGSWI